MKGEKWESDAMDDGECDHHLVLESDESQPIDHGLVVSVGCTECGLVGEAAIDVSEITWMGVR